MWRWALLLLLAPLPALGTVLFDWGFEELARRSDLVVIGTVASKETVAVDRTLMTDTRVTVERTLVGKPEKVVIIRQLGGQLGDRIVDVPGDATLEKGQKYLLFTAKHGDHRYLVGMALGALRVTKDGLTQTIDAPLLSRGGTTRRETAPRAVSLAEIERITREAKK